MRCYFSLLTLFAVLFSVNGQNIYFRHYQVEEGLANNTVICAAQDKYGFMWFGTKDGLSRFDGYTFKTYKKNQKNSNYLTSNSITVLRNDSRGNFWVGTEKGLFSYNEKTDDFSFLKNSPPDAIKGIVSFKNNLWFIAGFDLCEYNSKTKEIINFSKLYELPLATTLNVDSKNTLWIGTIDGKIAKYDEQAHTFIKYILFDFVHPINSYQINEIFDDGQGTLLIGTVAQGLKKFFIKDGIYKNIITKSKNGTQLLVRSIERYSSDKIWLATEDGLYIYEPNKEQFSVLKNTNTDPYSISDDAVYALIKDSQGGMWVGTYFGGINYYNDGNIKINQKHHEEGAKTISGNRVREIVQDKKGNLWIGTEDAGINKFDLKKQTFTAYKPADGSGLSYSNIHGLAIDGNTLWIGTYENGLDVMDLSMGKIIHHYSADNSAHSLKSNFIYSILKTSVNDLYLTTSNGLYKYNRRKDNFHLFNELPFNTFYAPIVEAKDGTIWVGTFSSGLYFINEEKKINGKLRIIKSGANVLEQTRVLYLKFDTDNNLWIATENGLYKILQGLKSVVEYNISQGFPSSMIYTITQDTDKNYWVTTSKGLVRIDYKTNQLRIFTKSDGLLSDQFNYSSAFIDSNNNLYLGNTKGLIFFNTKDYKNSNYIPPLYIINFSLANKNGNGGVNKINFTNKNFVQLKHNESSFNIEFAAIDYTTPENIQYAYKLLGRSPEWNYIRNNRSVFFTNLPSGYYTFIIKSTNGDGVWVNNENTLIIKILPPLWQSSGAKIIYALTVILILFFFYLWQNKKQHAKQERRMEIFEINKQKELYQNQIELFTNMAHEIKTPLTLIKGPMDKIMRSVDEIPQIAKDLKVMSRNTDRLYELSKQLLDFRKLESNQFSISFTKIDLLSYTKSIIADFELLSETLEKPIIVIAQEDKYIVEGDKDAIRKIITNLIANALKYGKSFLKISFHRNNNIILLNFSNDGPIIPEKATGEIFKPFFRLNKNDNGGGTGIGLSLARSLTQLHNGQLRFKTEGLLNIFELELPTKQQYQ